MINDNAEYQLEDLKKAIVEAIAILDNDLFKHRVKNAKLLLTDALDEHGWPDE